MDTEDDKKKIKIGILIREDVQESLIKLFHEYKDVFAWSYQDMPGSVEELVEVINLDIEDDKKKN